MPLIVIDLEEAKHGPRTRRRARPTSTLRTSPRHHQKHTFALNTKPPVIHNPQVQLHLLQYVLPLALAPRHRSHTTLPLMGSCLRAPSALSSAKTVRQYLPFLIFSRNHCPSVPSAKPKSPSAGPRPRVQSQFSRNRLEIGPRSRVYKPKGPSRSRMKLDNTRRIYPSVHAEAHLSRALMHDPRRSQRTQGKKKYVDKPCPRFNTTGALSPTSFTPEPVPGSL